MIEINLLPEEKRRKKRSIQMPDVSQAFLPVVVAVAGILVFVHILILFAFNIKNLAYANMGREWSEMRLQKELIEIVRRDNIKIKKDASAIEDLMKKKVLWSKKLNQLSDLILPGVWFTRITIDKKIVTTGSQKEMEKREVKYLNIEGVVSSAYGDELGIIGRFIKHLKDDPSFLKDFSNIELGSTQLRSISNIDVMEFNIYCYLKE